MLPNLSVMSLPMDMDLVSVRCPHLAGIHVDESESAALLRRYKTVIRWSIHRAAEVAYPTKRRKVSIVSAVLPEHGRCCDMLGGL